MVDGGSPFGASCTVAADGSSRDGGQAGLTGYSVIEAVSVRDAADKAKGCPVLASGGSVEVYEAIPM